jgi:CBS domain-containing protein
MKPMLVRNCMTAPAVVETPDASIAKLVAIMRLRRISAVPIVRDGALAGIVSTTDILRAPGEARASDVMSTHVVTAAEGDRLDDAARLFVAGRVHRVVAVDGHRVKGILSPRDAIRPLRRRRLLEPISSVMTTPVETIDVGDSVEDSVARLATAGVHGLVVTDGGRPIGVFTHAEALAARKLPQSLRTTPVEKVMSYETICVDSITPIYRAAAYVDSMDVRRILVVDHRQLVGIVSVVDLVDVLARAPEVPS